jgi:hypothetical protein
VLLDAYTNENRLGNISNFTPSKSLKSMRKSAILIVFICLFFSTLTAQGTLQFNQVLLLQTSQSGSVLLGTVPAGKVWKIEAAGGVPQNFCRCRFSFDVTSSSANSAFSIGWLLEGNEWRRWEKESETTSTIWLPAGTPVSTTCSNCCGSSYTCPSTVYRYLSIIEFNVIP